MGQTNKLCYLGEMSTVAVKHELSDWTTMGCAATPAAGKRAKDQPYGQL